MSPRSGEIAEQCVARRITCSAGEWPVAQVGRPPKVGGDLRLLRRASRLAKTKASGLRLPQQPDDLIYKISIGNFGGKQKRPGAFPGRNFLQEQYNTVVKHFVAAKQIASSKTPTRRKTNSPAPLFPPRCAIVYHHQTRHRCGKNAMRKRTPCSSLVLSMAEGGRPRPGRGDLRFFSRA